MSIPSSGLYEFGPFRLDVDQRVFTRSGQVLPLAPKTFDLLVLMLQRPGHAFSKQELMSALWPDTFVEEANLSFQVSALRKALGDGAAHWIETIPKHGYRFIASINSSSPATPETSEDHADEHGGLRWSFRSRSQLSSEAWFRRWNAPGPTKWLTAIVAASALALSSYVVVSRSRGAAPATVGVPITDYLGVAAQPSISPDGNKVAFRWALGSGSNADIYVKAVGNGEPQRLTTNPARDSAPAWSPDGRQIAFVRSTTEGTSADVIVIPAAGGVERTVITMSVPAVGRNQIHDLDWAPDGRWIAVGGQPATNDSPGIWLVALDGGLRRPLTNAPSDGRDHRPAFSPDGTRLAFLRTAAGSPTASTSVHVLSLSPDLMAAGPPTRVALEDRGRKSGTGLDTGRPRAGVRLGGWSFRSFSS